jgi:hypothetical protein
MAVPKLKTVTRTQGNNQALNRHMGCAASGSRTASSKHLRALDQRKSVR